MKIQNYIYSTLLKATLVTLSLMFFVACDDDDETALPPTPVEDTVLTGDLTEDRKLVATEEYAIKGAYLVKSGATLTIPAGTVLVSEVGTGNYIAVEQGGKIDVQGTASAPVVMRSADSNPGDWGGLLLCGKATTTEGVNATAEVGGLIYGGDDDSDNSGSINYLIIKGAGAQINSESQYNGLTLYAVGSGTKINNVAVIDGDDDGVEFFGGTVSATNLYFENNSDDSVDWTEGWSGTITNTYISHTIAGFSTVVEADGANNNPRIIDLTAVSTVGGTALQFKKQSGATIVGLSLQGYEKRIDMKDNGPLANVKIEGVAANPALGYDGTATVDIADFAWATSNTGGGTEDATLSGDLTSDRVLNSNVEYTIDGAFLIKDGAKLTIPAGTVLVSKVGTGNYIAVEQGGKIDVQGTESAPVVMRSANSVPGDWGGLLLCGKATTTEGVNATAEVGGLIYGGTEDTDNSGSINYLVIKGAGAQINSESQYNGLTLYAVGSGTTISNVAVIDGDDDGVEFFGGTVSATNLYFENNSDDSVDWTEGWNGTITNTFVHHTIAGFSTVVEADGANNNPKIVNLTAFSSVAGTALQFKKQSGATITGLSLIGYATRIDMKDDGALANVVIEGEAGHPSLGYDGAATVDIADFAWATSNTSIPTESTTLSGSISSNRVLNSTKTYVIDGGVRVKSGATLTIPAGTTIKSNVGTGNFLAVEVGGKINLTGTNDHPVVMDSNASTPAPGDWGGLLLCGDATTTEGVDAVAEVAGLVYGGTDNDDNSGTVEYLVIKNAGAQINSESQYNGLTLYGVGSGTTISNVAVIDGDDDGVEFFGGTVSATNLYFENNSDDSVDWTEGWNGTITNTYVSHTVAGFSTAVEADGTNNNPKIVNFTAVSSVDGTALQFKKTSGATITGLHLSGYAKNIDMKDSGPLANVQIEGNDASTSASYTATALDISSWTWFK